MLDLLVETWPDIISMNKDTRHPIPTAPKTASRGTLAKTSFAEDGRRRAPGTRDREEKILTPALSPRERAGEKPRLAEDGQAVAPGGE